MTLVTGFSVWPLRLASIVGFAFTCLGGALLVYVLARYVLEGGSVPGFPFLASIVVIFSGAQLFALGVMGEYLARMYFRLMDRPPYVVESTANLDPESPA
jgi:undecaprenyl-phosphate 4-deoxy-4-formamido-L-arabinose transferase